MRMSYNNYLDTTSALTALTENINYPLVNVQDQRLSKTYQSQATTAQTITVNLGSAINISTAAILAHNFTSSCTVTISANTSNSWGSPATTKTIIYNAGVMLNFFTPVSYQYWQFTIDDPTNADRYIEIGRLWLGDYLTVDPSSNIDFTVSKKRSDRVLHGQGRQKFASIGITWKEFELSFPSSNYTMIDNIGTLYDTVGQHTSFIFCNLDTIRGISLLTEPCYVAITDDIGFTNEEGRKMTYSLKMAEEK
jgi:hypothetical protein